MQYVADTTPGPNGHVHQAVFNGKLNGQTTHSDGHAHRIIKGRVQLNAGHSHSIIDDSIEEVE